MKKLLLSIYLILSIGFNQFLYGQISPFAKVIYNEVGQSIKASDIAKTTDGGFIVVGGTLSNNGLIMKINSNGNPLWSRTFQTSSSFMNFFEITNTHDSCFVIGGKIFNDESNTWDIFLIKINDQNQFLWINNFTMDYDNECYLTSVIETSDTGYIITGYTHEPDQFPRNQILVIKTNSDGDFEWSKKYSAENNVNKAYSIKELDNGGFTLSGELNSLSNNMPRAFMMNISEEGDVIWAQKYIIDNQSNTPTFLYDTEAINSELTALMSINGTTVLMRTDLNGEFEWGKDYHYPSEYYNQTPKIHRTSDDAFIFLSGAAFGYYTKTDLDGNILQTANLRLMPEAIVEVNHKGLLIIGNGPITDDKLGNEHIGIILIDSLGNGTTCIDPQDNNYSYINVDNVPIIMNTENTGSQRYQVTLTSWIFPNVNEGCIDVIGGISKNTTENFISIYPNPNQGIFSIESETFINGNLSVLNNIGQIVFEENISLDQINIDLSEQTNGIYFYKIEKENQLISSGRLIIQK